MKITSFNMIIASSPENFEKNVAVFEALGFKKNHSKQDSSMHAFNMKDEDGHKVDLVSASTVGKDMMTIRMNVDDLDEAVKFFTERGFVNPNGIHDTGSSLSCMMVSPSGFTISIAKHVK